MGPGLSFSLQKCVDHLDRALAGCCWDVYATRADPKESLPSLRQVSKCLTMMLAAYLAKEVAAILRAHISGTAALIRNRPSSSFFGPSPHTLGHPKKLKPSASGTRFTDWIGGICYAAMRILCRLWFPAHWVPAVLHQLQQHKEDAYRAAHPSGRSSG